MRKRIEGSGSECQVESAPGKGTTVRFIVRVEN
jgi:signal transduction histidine kinase